MRKNYIKDQLNIFLSKKYFRWFLKIFDWYRSRGKWNEQEINFNSKNIKEDLIVLYRISPYPNGKSPIYQNDKFKLTKLCLDSFFKAFRDQKPYVFFLLDSCPNKYSELVKKYKFNSEIVKLSKAGNKGSWFAQIDIASKFQKNKKVYFAEDDYFYLKDAGKLLIEALKEHDFITLTDHANYYEKPMGNKKHKIKLFNNHHLRTVESSCLSFGTQSELIKKYKNLFKKYGTFDHPLWTEIKEKGFEIWCPVPSLGTHLVKDQLAPGIGWEKYIE